MTAARNIRPTCALFALSMLLMLPGCAEINYMSHVVKQALPGEDDSTPSRYTGKQGSFKVGAPYRVAGQWYYPKEQYDLSETGLASWYGPGFHGKRTASGEVYNSNELTAAHRTLQMPSLVRVTNLDNGRSVIVRVNDRGPYRRGRIMDVSSKAADLLGMKGAGTAKIKMQVLKEESMRLAQLAKSGVNVRGYEVAMNEPRDDGAQYSRGPEITPEPVSYQTAGLQPVSREALPPGPVPGHLDQGTFYPDPVVTNMPVTPTSIYVQAGSFTMAGNAQRLRDKLSNYRTARVLEAMVDGTRYYRVRLGPVANVSEADELLDQMLRDGHSKAIIVVE
jgi:rare lipoprotein A